MFMWVAGSPPLIFSYVNKCNTIILLYKHKRHQHDTVDGAKQWVKS